jgi:uncharacterized repeat protein (TIGR03803 family)
MSKRNRWMRAGGVFFLWATMAVASHAQTTAVAPPAATFTTLHSFDGADGQYPEAGLVQGTTGNFYGTTYDGGVNNDGAVFKITPSGTLTTLHSFDGTDGSLLIAGLARAANGDF